MRKVREVLRLKFDGGQTNRRIARSCQISRPTVADYLLRFEAAGLQWPAAAALDDTALEHKLFPQRHRHRLRNALFRTGATSIASCAARG